MNTWINKLVTIEIVLIFLVIIAGSVVRMTGSGMGCPDWPKCFGHLIPPTERSQIEWKANTEFKKNQMIIIDESLKLAKADIITNEHYNDSNWTNYTKHDYAIFNPYHTWIEYINRLLGALSGIPMILIFIFGILNIKKNWLISLLGAAGLFMLGFEAWLGKLVVDGNLIPGSITIHMMGALLILAILFTLRAILNREKQTKAIKTTGAIRFSIIALLILGLIQIGLGTQVREQVDYLAKEGLARTHWIENLNWQFYVHRSFSLLITALSLYLAWAYKNGKSTLKEIPWILLIIIIEIVFGIMLSYLAVPAFAQPLHLLLGSLMFGLQFSALLSMSIGPKSQSSS